MQYALLCNMPLTVTLDQWEGLPTQGEPDGPDPCPCDSSSLTREKKNRFLGT